MRDVNAPELASYAKSGFQRINRALRTDTVNAATADLIGTIDAQLSAMDQATCGTVYRYGGLLTEYTVASLQTGQSFQDKAYLSTSKDIAAFDRWGPRKGHVLMTIHLLGHDWTQAHDLARLIGAKDRENEVLFPRNTRFLLTAYENPKWRSGIFVTMQETRHIERV